MHNYHSSSMGMINPMELEGSHKKDRTENFNAKK
jgi:hypothetical protein